MESCESKNESVEDGHNVGLKVRGLGGEKDSCRQKNETFE